VFTYQGPFASRSMKSNMLRIDESRRVLSLKKSGPASLGTHCRAAVRRLRSTVTSLASLFSSAVGRLDYCPPGANSKSLKCCNLKDANMHVTLIYYERNSEGSYVCSDRQSTRMVLDDQFRHANDPESRPSWQWHSWCSGSRDGRR